MNLSLGGRARHRARRRQLFAQSTGWLLLVLPSTVLVGCYTDSNKPSALSNAAVKTVAAVRADSDMQTVLDAFAAFDPKAIEKIAPQEARLQPTIADAVKAVLKQQGRDATPSALSPGVTARELTVQGTVGSLGATLYKPAASGPLPLIVYFHGGGWVFGSRQVYDAGARGLAVQAQALVLSIDYRLAPENKFPAAHDDAVAAYRWAITNAASLGADGRRFALAGESAGGNLAVATAIAARDAGLAAPVHVLTVYPVAQRTMTTASYEINAIAKPLNKPMMQWFFNYYLRSPTDAGDPRIDLVHADLHGLPTTTIINATIDPLEDDGEQLETALRSAGVNFERRVFDGVTHEFFGTAAVVRKARDAQAYAGARLTQSFAGSGGRS